MRLLVALPPLEEFSSFTGGAVSTVVEALARHWIAAGHDVAVLGQSCDSPYETVPSAFHGYRLPEPNLLKRGAFGLVRHARRYDWPVYSPYLKSVREATKRMRPDWLLVHNDLVLPALMCDGLRGTQLALTLHNSVQSRHPTRALRSLECSDVVSAVSSYIADETAVTMNLGEKRIQVVHNGVDNQLYSGRVEHNATDPLRVAFIGRLLADKGPLVLLEAVTLLKERGVSCVPTFVGSPAFRRSTADLSDPVVAAVNRGSKRLGGSYHQHLDRRGVRDLLATQDVVAVPSLFQDPFPLTVFESMASGCAVVTSDRGGLPEAAGHAGLVTAAGDAGALCDVLYALHCDRALLDRTKTACLARAQSNDWSAVATRWLELLQT